MVKNPERNTAGDRIRRYVIPVVLAAIACAGDLRAEPAEPKKPDDPVIGTSSKKDGSGTDFEVTVITAKGERITGFFLAGAAIVEAEVAEKGGVVKKNIPLSAIASVEILRWQGKPVRKEEYVFRPARIKMTLADKTVYECVNDIRLFDRMRVRALNRVRAVYAYYYDYRSKNRWKNSGKEDMRYPETNPHGDTVVQIIFSRAEPGSFLERFLGK